MDVEAVLRNWHQAVNSRDEAALATCLAEDVALAGPRDVRSGRQEAIDWVHRSGILLDPTNWHPVNEHEMVVEEEATWPGNEESLVIYVRYRVERGVITAIHRFVNLQDALAAD